MTLALLSRGSRHVCFLPVPQLPPTEPQLHTDTRFLRELEGFGEARQIQDAKTHFPCNLCARNSLSLSLFSSLLSPFSSSKHSEYEAFVSGPGQKVKAALWENVVVIR